MTLRLPQARDFDKLRRLLELLAEGLDEPQAIGVCMGAKPKYAARHASYYLEAAEVLGLVEQGRGALTARGRAYILTEAHSDDSKLLLREAVASATQLGKLADAILSRDEPDVETLIDHMHARLHESLSRETVARRVRDLLSWRTRLGVGRSWARPLPRTRRRAATQQLDLLERVPGIAPSQWPDPTRLPFNWTPTGEEVARVVVEDLRASRDVLIVTGFASLRRLCEFVGTLDPVTPARVRLVVGCEPFEGRQGDRETVGVPPSQEVADYWLNRGFSIRDIGDVQATVAALESGRLQARIYRAGERLHAKMYVGDTTLTVGSSNFTEPGMARQLEANVRLVESGDDSKTYRQARSLAEIYWQLAESYTDELSKLLHELIQKVTWQEALARACAELLEGEWARLHLRDELGMAETLWPTQLQGIGQALYVLMEVGSVLIADATGSGKTRTGAWLLRALCQRLVGMGRDIAVPVLISPPAVLDGWARELQRAEVGVNRYSHGSLSSTRAGNRDEVITSVGASRVLAIDEAHNFVNPSMRTEIVNANFAEHVVLFTATPINRDARDLLGIVDLLGADNLDDSTLKILLDAGARRDKPLREEEQALLRRAVSAFTVRRTKAMLNASIDRDPLRYRNELEQPCRYPRHVAQYYALHESASDCAIAREISDLARELRGALWFRKQIRLPEHLEAEGCTPEQYVTMRLRSARALARHHVRASLRSSRAALAEHLHGTDSATKSYRLHALDKEDSGDVIGQIGALRDVPPPEHDRRLALPDWLRDASRFREACDEDLAIYRRISTAASGMSDGREREKVAQMRRLCRAHGLVVAFDTKPITLHVLKNMFDKEDDPRVFVAIGGNRALQRVVRTAFRLGSGERGVALCSNAMSEGINLQQAAAIIHLDMPSVVRLAEQRVGRVDRMDSPHDRIESWWPRDAEEFALSSDERLGARLELVEKVLGANVFLPQDDGDDASVVDAEAVVRELEAAEQKQIELLDDAFAPVRGFIEGSQRLVEPGVYAALRKSKARVVSAIAVVKAEFAWGFFAIRGSGRTAPRWAYVDARDGATTTALTDVARCLRDGLRGCEDIELDSAAVSTMDRLLAQLEASVETLLPRRKRRALEQMREVLSHYARVARRDEEPTRAPIANELLALTRHRGIDLDQLVDGWLAVLRPRWRALLALPRRRKASVRRIAALTAELQRVPLGVEVLAGLRDGARRATPVADRVVAAIIGVAAS